MLLEKAINEVLEFLGINSMNGRRGEMRARIEVSSRMKMWNFSKDFFKVVMLQNNGTLIFQPPRLLIPVQIKKLAIHYIRKRRIWNIEILCITIFLKKNRRRRWLRKASLFREYESLLKCISNFPFLQTQSVVFFLKTKHKNKSI